MGNRIVLPLLAAGVGLGACGDAGPARATLSVAETLAGTDTVGYTRAVRPPTLRFPGDHGPHPGFKHEWWYFTGNLETIGEADRDLGFQLTFFRSALRPAADTAAATADTIGIDSDWAADQAYMAHFALTDIGLGDFYAFERFDRAALGLAGAGPAEEGLLRVWVGDWEAVLEEDTRDGSGSPGARPGFVIRAAEGPVALELRLRPTQPIVLQGERGLSRKGPEPGNASHYYSMMRLDARGTVTIAGAELPVRGQAWLDREWSTSALSPGIAGWDWFALQLDDDSELMLYRLRTDDGGTAPFSAGTFVAPDGQITRLSADDFQLEPTGAWTSPRGGRYPAGWQLRVPRLDLALEVEPRVSDQELDLAFRYWEGAVAATGSRGGAEVSGRGYVELTGYAR